MLWRTRSSIRRADVVNIGQQANGAPFGVPLSRVSTLIAGLPGSGKSSTLAAVVVGVAPLPDLAVLIADPKRVSFTHATERCMVARGGDECADMLAELVRLIEGRYELLEDQGTDTWPGSRVLLLVDELAEILASGDKRADRARAIHLRRVLQLGRAAGVTVIGATQRPSAALVDSDVRGLFGARLAHALDGPDAVKMAGLDPDLAPAHKIPLGAKHAGLAWLSVDGSRQPIYGRTWQTSRELVEKVCRANAGRWHDPFLSTPMAPATRALVSAGVAVGHGDAQSPRDAHVAALVPPSEHGSAWPAPASSPVEFDLIPGQRVASGETLGEDAATVLEVVRRRPIGTADLPKVTGLSEGRCRRARQHLERAGMIRSTPNGWAPT